MNLRLSILNFLLPVSKLISKIHSPFSRKKISSKHIDSIKTILHPGSVLITVSYGELANIFIPGDFSHAAIYAPVEGYVVEAKTTGVVNTNLLDFMISKDRVVVLHPVFTDDDGMKLASLVCASMIGLPYDFYFDPDNKAFYCSELIEFGYRKFDTWTKRESMGTMTVLPSDFINSAKSKTPKWSIVWDSKNV